MGSRIIFHHSLSCSYRAGNHARQMPSLVQVMMTVYTHIYTRGKAAVKILLDPSTHFHSRPKVSRLREVVGRQSVHPSKFPVEIKVKETGEEDEKLAGRFRVSHAV